MNTTCLSGHKIGPVGTAPGRGKGGGHPAPRRVPPGANLGPRRDPGVLPETPPRAYPAAASAPLMATETLLAVSCSSSGPDSRIAP